MPLVRWVLPKLITTMYPYFLALNETFGQTPFAPRVGADGRGFYAALLASLRARCAFVV